MGELFLVPVILIAILIAVPTICFLLISLFDGFPRLKIMQIVRIVAVAAWIFTPFALGPWDEVPFMIFSGLGLLLLFFATWRREFRLLMLRSDDDFPGRFDKLGWFLLLTFAAPAGTWLFRSFRKARWPDVDARKVVGLKTPQNPWDHEEEDRLSPTMAGVE